jgi:hypothetical protein
MERVQLGIDAIPRCKGFGQMAEVNASALDLGAIASQIADAAKFVHQKVMREVIAHCIILSWHVSSSRCFVDTSGKSLCRQWLPRFPKVAAEVLEATILSLLGNIVVELHHRRGWLGLLPSCRIRPRHRRR